MKKDLKYITLIGICFAAFACNSISDSGTTELKDSIQEKSELAALMRVMEVHGDEVRLALKTGQSLPERPEGIDKLLDAAPTPNMHIDEQTFPVFVDAYLKSVNQLYAASFDDRREVYNGLVQSCSNCHTVNCPGPLMKIDKMFLGQQ